MLKSKSSPKQEMYVEEQAVMEFIKIIIFYLIVLISHRYPTQEQGKLLMLVSLHDPLHCESFSLLADESVLLATGFTVCKFTERDWISVRLQNESC